MHILSPGTDNCLSYISGRERMVVENNHDQSPRKNVAGPDQVGRASDWATEASRDQEECQPQVGNSNWKDPITTYFAHKNKKKSLT